MSSITRTESWNVTTEALEFETFFSSEFFTANSSTRPGRSGSDQDSPGLSWSASVVVAVFSSFISFVTVFGNVIVIYAFCTTQKLRTYTNYFLVSLAVSDIVAGAITMPLYSVYWILGYWPFSDALCDAYLYLNHAFIHISVMAIVIIAYDRWQALEMPIKHLQKRTLKHAMFLITISYMIPGLIWLPGCLLWPYIVGERTIKPGLCYPQYVDSLVFTCLAPCILFWFPLLLISAIYGRVFIIIRRSAKRRSTKRRAVTMTDLGRSTSKGEVVEREDEESIPDNNASNSLDNKCNLEDNKFVKKTFFGRQPVYIISSSSQHGQVNNAYLPEDMRKGHHQNQANWFRSKFRNEQSGEESQIRRENIRATKTLTLIFIAMVVSSTPWSALVPVYSICSECIPLALYQASVYLAHVNSTLDPFCYAIANPLFREAFLSVLCCRRNQTNKLRNSSRTSTR